MEKIHYNYHLRFNNFAQLTYLQNPLENYMAFEQKYYATSVVVQKLM